MSPIFNDAYTIHYGTLTVGGSTDYRILNKPSLVVGHDRFRLTVDVLITGASAAALATAIDALETEAGLPHKRCYVELSGSTVFDSDAPASTTDAYDPLVEISQPGSPEDTARSRLYSLQVTGAIKNDDLKVTYGT